MKIIHLNRNFISHSTGHDLFELGNLREKEGDREGAVAAYLAMIKKNYQREYGYRRLMILYRNLKEPKLELEIIEEALTEFRKLFSSRREAADKKVVLTSKKLMKMMGMSDDGNDYPQPIPIWTRRRELLKKAMRKHKLKSKHK